MSLRSHSIQDAVAASPLLQSLRQRSVLGQQRLALLQRLLPPTLTQQLQSGACDDTQWCLLCPNTAVAAKLRQWLPEIEAQLHASEARPLSVRVKVSRAA